MNAAQIVYVLRWLIRDTFRQAVAGRVFWIMLGVSSLAIIFCLSLHIEGGESMRPEKDFLYDRTGRILTGPNQHPGHLSLLFGAFRVELHRDGESEVHLIQVILGTWVAGAVGLLLTLVWTANFLPDALQPSSAVVLLAKPTPRWLFLLGKYLGVVAFVAAQAFIFFAGTWLALGTRTGIWLYGYLAGLPLLVFQFAVLYSFSVFVAVWLRSTVACVFGVLLFWMLCMAVNYGRHSSVALPALAPEAEHLSPLSRTIVEVGYWAMPKPADQLMILEDALDAHAHKATLSGLPEFHQVRQQGDFDPLMSLLTSLLFCVVMLGFSGQQLAKVEY